jgi:hypothetical protein
VGEGDLVDVCRLTCLEQGVAVEEDLQQPVPALEAHGLKVVLVMDKQPSENGGSRLSG